MKCFEMGLTPEQIARISESEPRQAFPIELFVAAGLDEEYPQSLSFLADERYISFVASNRGAIIVPQNFPVDQYPQQNFLLAKDPYYAFLRTLYFWIDQEKKQISGQQIAPSAVIGADVVLPETIELQDHVVLGNRVKIGAGTCIMAGTVIGDDVEIGENTLIYPNVTVYENVQIGSRVIIHAGAVIGSDGFGHMWNDEYQQYLKIPQIGTVVVEDDVEIGANTTIDRATLGVTRVSRGSKLDNLVQLGHNVQIGPHGILCAQVGIAGGSSTGKRVTLGGQVGVANNVHIGDGARVGAQSGVDKDLADEKDFFGTPARVKMEAWRQMASLSQLPQFTKRLKSLERKVEEIDANNPTNNKK